MPTGDTTGATAPTPTGDSTPVQTSAGETPSTGTGSASTGSSSSSPVESSAGVSPAGSSFDWDKWDGDEKLIPESFQAAWKRFGVLHGDKLRALEADVDLYRDIAFGGKDDPRAREWEKEKARLSGEVDTHKGKLAEAERREQELRAQIDAYEEKSARDAVEAFKARHKDIVADPAKRQELVSLLDAGWEEDAAAMLVGMSSQVRERAEKLVQEYHLRGTGHRLAVQQARAELGNQKPSASASSMITSGATGSASPARDRGHDIRGMSRDEARNEAARLALVHARR